MAIITEIKGPNFYTAKYLHHIATGATEEEAKNNLLKKLELRGIKPEEVRNNN